jgi:hypothetical protein
VVVEQERGGDVAGVISGVAWEFYDVLRPGMRFTSSKIPRELVIARGLQGQVIFHHSEIFYWNNCGALTAKAYGRLIHVPVEQMGATRVMPVERLGERMLYNREPHHYSAAEIEKLSEALEKQQRRGARVLSWEEVDEGDELPNIVQPPYSIRDALTYQALDHGLLAA